MTSDKPAPRCLRKVGRRVRCGLDKCHDGDHRYELRELEDAFRVEPDPELVQEIREALIAELAAQEREHEVRITRALEAIADTHLHITTLRPRNSDALDFHTLGVTSIEDALRAALALGRDEMDREWRERITDERRSAPPGRRS